MDLPNSPTACPRVLSAVLVVASLLGMLALAPSSPAVAQPPTSSFCSDGAPEPCVVSASVDGVPVDASDPDHDVVVVDRSGDAQAYGWAVTTADGDFDLGDTALGHTWRITIRASVDPRFVFVHGQPGTIARGSGTVTIESAPVVVTNGCDAGTWPWTCPDTADTDWDATLDGEVSDFGQWTDTAQRETFRGYDMFTNIDVTSVPIEIDADPVTGDPRLLVRMANSHYRVDGTTPVVGFMTQRIPGALLADVYGIDDLAGLTGSGVVTSLTGPGTGTVSVAVDGDALVLDASGLSFSRRVVRVEAGVVVPTRPRRIHATRIAAHRARITYRAPSSRGSSITRQIVRCVADDGSRTVRRRASPAATRVVVRGLRASTSYRCSVRALSAAGPGRWSRGVRAR